MGRTGGWLVFSFFVAAAIGSEALAADLFLYQSMSVSVSLHVNTPLRGEDTQEPRHKLADMAAGSTKDMYVHNKKQERSRFVHLPQHNDGDDNA